MPGIIDTHVHLCGSGLENGYKMLAKAGVATAIDFGQAEGIARESRERSRDKRRLPGRHDSPGQFTGYQRVIRM